MNFSVSSLERYEHNAGQTMTILSKALLDSYMHSHISNICLNRFDQNNFNHCAHFVGHALQLSHGKTCHRMVYRGHRIMDGGTILVSDLFDITPNVRELDHCPTTGQGLIYVSAPSSFQQIGSHAHRIKTVRKRHMGLLLNGVVWHYSNLNRKVISQPAAQFLEHFKRQKNALWIGDLPAGSRPVFFGTSG